MTRWGDCRITHANDAEFALRTHHGELLQRYMTLMGVEQSFQP